MCVCVFGVGSKLLRTMCSTHHNAEYTGIWREGERGGGGGGVKKNEKGRGMLVYLRLWKVRSSQQKSRAGHGQLKVSA